MKSKLKQSIDYRKNKYASAKNTHIVRFTEIASNFLDQKSIPEF